MKKLFLVFSIIVGYLLLTTNSYAQYGATIAPSPRAVIEKQVSMPTQDKKKAEEHTFVDNLFPADPRFSPEQDIFFRIRAKNASNVTLSNIHIVDFVPASLQPVEGSGSFNSNSRTITIDTGAIKPDEERIMFIKMQVLPNKNLPSDKTLFCDTNRVEATSEQAKADDSDQAQFCIEKPGRVTIFVTPTASKIPSTGPEMGVLLILTQIAGLGLGLILHNKSSNN